MGTDRGLFECGLAVRQDPGHIFDRLNFLRLFGGGSRCMRGHCDEGEFRAHNDWISVYS